MSSKYIQNCSRTTYVRTQPWGAPIKFALSVSVSVHPCICKHGTQELLKGLSWNGTLLRSNKISVHIPIWSLTKIMDTIWKPIRDSVVGIVTGYGLDDRGTVKNFLFSTSSRPALGLSQPPIQWVPEALSPGAKRQGREADHSPPASDEVKKIWFYIYPLRYTPSWGSA
jgi:hypothetical protein